MGRNTAMQVAMALRSDFKGPSLDKGPLPAVIYLALSAEESLHLDPFNQPVNALLEQPNLRVFSFDLPGHGNGLDKMKAMSYWSEHLEEVTSFIEQAKEQITALTQKGYLNDQLIVAGLSRGSYLGLQLAAHDPRIKAVCGFAPLVKLDSLDEFKHAHAPAIDLNLLVDKSIRLYIGNHDTRVGTENAYHFIKDLTQISLDKGVRSPQTELIIYPSIGYKGHGTPPEVFESGAEWMAAKLAG